MTRAMQVPGRPELEVLLRRSARARRLSLRVSRLDGRVTLTMPVGVPEREGTAFLAEKADWLEQMLGTLPPPVLVAEGVSVPVEGRMLPVVRDTRSGLHADRIAVARRVRMVAPHVGGLLRTLARERLAAASDHHAARLGKPYSQLTLRDTRSRWGSCSSFGALMYSWRLVLAPPDVLDYVAAHEVAHLAQMNHSPAFWAEVRALCPGFEGPRAWLRQHGESLHRYRFDAGA